MKSTDLITPIPLSLPIATNGNYEIPDEVTTSGKCSISQGFMPITSTPIEDGGQAPERTDFNGLFLLSTDQKVFNQNGGVITFNQTVSNAIGGYPKNAILGYIDTNNNYRLVQSLIDDNTYNFIATPSYIDDSKWKFVSLYDNAAISSPIIRLDDTLLDGEIRLEGATVSRTTYASLFAKYGTTYGAGDGSTTFQLPDFRNRAIWGADSFGYLTAGLPNITGYVRGGLLYSAGGTFGAFQMTYNNRYGDGDEGADSYTFNFDASRSNAIYGANSTVQPPAIKVRVVTRYR